MCVCTYICKYTHTRTHTHPGTCQCGLQSETLVQTTIKMEKTKPGLHHCLLGLAEDPRSVLPEYTAEKCSLASVCEKPSEQMYPYETRKAVLSTRPGNQNLGTKSDFWGVSAVSTNSLRSVLTKAEPNLDQDSSKSCNRHLLGPKGSAESR